MSIKAVLFDKDGTLVDFHLTWSAAYYDAMLKMSGGDAEKLARLIEFSDFDVESRRIRPSSTLIADSSADYGVKWAEILGETADQAFFTRMDDILNQECLKYVSPIGDPSAVLSDLRQRGYLLGICTNDSEAGARSQCERLGLMPLLDSFIGYDSGYGRKPAPGPVLGFASVHSLAPAEIALVGDSLHDLHAARAAGSVAIAVLSGFSGREELEPHADHVIADVMELPALLTALA